MKGESILLNGQTYAASGVFENHFTGANGCDSTHILDLTVLSKTYKKETFSICEGASFLVFDTLVVSSFVQTRTFIGANGCDSIHTISVEVKEIFQETNNISICAGDSITILGRFSCRRKVEYIKKNYIANNGCDSLVNVAVDVIEPIHSYATITMCDKEAIAEQEKNEYLSK